MKIIVMFCAQCSLHVIHIGCYRSDVGPEVGFEAVGLIDAQLETVGVWAKTKEAPPPAEVVIATNTMLN